MELDTLNIICQITKLNIFMLFQVTRHIPRSKKWPNWKKKFWIWIWYLNLNFGLKYTYLKKSKFEKYLVSDQKFSEATSNGNCNRTLYTAYSIHPIAATNNLHRFWQNKHLGEQQKPAIVSITMTFSLLKLRNEIF